MNHYACAIIVEDGRILLGLRAPHRRAYANCWDVIGGKVEAGETVDQALVRELAEELGIVPADVASMGQMVDRSPRARGEATYHMFAVTAWTGGAPVMRDNEHVRLDWFTIEQACALPNLALPEYRALFRRVAFP